jgi:hypothetical protein
MMGHPGATSGSNRSPMRTSSGMRVSADNALRLAAVYASVRILAETMAVPAVRALPATRRRWQGPGDRSLAVPPAGEAPEPVPEPV